MSMHHGAEAAIPVQLKVGEMWILGESLNG